MPKPKSQKELLDISQKNYELLIALIDSYSQKELKREFPIGTLNRNIKDVLAHLHHWHLMMLEWYTIGMTGQKPNMPAKGYTWKTLPDLNKKIWEKYKNTKLVVIRKKLTQSYEEIQKIIEKHNDQELFEKNKYKWTGTTSLGVYLISNTSSHYNWAFRLIKKSMK